MFDFDATLPVMALQFLLLTVLLNAIFYKPLGKVLDERNDYIRSGQLGSQERLEEVKKLTQEYELELSSARKEAQKVLATAQADAQKIAADQLAAAQQEAIAQRNEAGLQIEEEKKNALSSLEGDVDRLSRQMLEKLLGADLVGQR
jgi:F-type H+-transporting ATPase subunit b